MCGDLPAHSHIYHLAIDPSPDGLTVVTHIPEPYDVRIWVDWKAVARDMMVEARLDERIDALHGPGAVAAIDKAYADGSIFSDRD